MHTCVVRSPVGVRGQVSYLVASVLLIFVLFPGARGVQAAIHETLDDALVHAATKLTLQGKLPTQNLLISPNDFYELGSGRSLPLALLLREKMVAEFSMRAVNVLLPGADEDQVNILQGQWRKDGNALSLSFKVMKLTNGGPQVVAAHTNKVAYSAISPELMEPDLASWGRYLVRNLEKQVRDFKNRTVHLKPVQVSGVAQPRALGEYLGDLLRPALAQSRLFQPMDAPVILAGLDTQQIRTRGIGIRKKEQQADPARHDSQKMSLTGDLLQADVEMVGKAYLMKGRIEVRVHMRDRYGRQVGAASARIEKSLFPQRLVQVKQNVAQQTAPTASGNLSLNGLTLDLATTRGEGKAEYRNGEKLQFIARANRSAHLYLFTKDNAGNGALLYPIPGVRVSPMEAGKPLILPDDGLPYELVVEPPFGEDYVWAVASEAPLEFPRNLPGDWGRFDILRQRLRGKGLQGAMGYAEADVALLTKAR